jgi:hypothetical protein
MRDDLVYIRPDEALTGAAAADFDKVLSEQSFSLAVVDGVTESNDD